MLRILSTTLLAFCTLSTISQTVTGSWYGRADVMMEGSNNNYLTELIVKQKGNLVEGIFGYYFKDAYQSFFIRGSYNPKTREVIIKNIPILYYRSQTRNGIECPMTFEGLLRVSQLKNSLNGYFYTSKKYRFTCPELRVSFDMDAAENQDSVLQLASATRKFWQPGDEDFVATVSPVTKDSPASITQQTQHSISQETQQALLAKLDSRKNTYMKDLELESDSIRISFYDNGDIDGDSISVFLNRVPVLVRQELSSRSLNLYLRLDTLQEVNELNMLAENLGKFPPNTALMVVTDGVNRHEVYLSSSLTQNATIRFKRKKQLAMKN